MFTGLVETMGILQAERVSAAGTRLTFESPLVAESSDVGGSVAVNGCCLTIVALDEKTFSVEAGLETLGRTNLGQLGVGGVVNLERPVRVGDPLGGHFVTGHIDCLGKVVRRDDDAEWATMFFEVPEPWDRHLASKGSIAIDGISLTIVDVDVRIFSVALIPHTLQVTTLGRKTVGELVNLETDVLAKYVERALNWLSYPKIGQEP